MQIITFILVVLPILYIITLFQSKHKKKINKQNYGIVMALGFLGLFLGALLTESNNITITLIIGAIGVSIVWGLLMILTLFILKKILNK